MVRTTRIARMALISVILLVCFLGFRLWLRGNSFDAGSFEPENVLYKGEIVETGTKDDILSNPEHDYTKHLLSSEL